MMDAVKDVIWGSGTAFVAAHLPELPAGEAVQPAILPSQRTVKGKRGATAEQNVAGVLI